MSGIVSGVANLVTGASKGPEFNQQASQTSQEQAAQAGAKYGLYGVDSSLGGVQSVQNPDGTYSRVFTDSAADVQRNQLIGQGLSGLSLDPSQAQDAYYQQATRQLLPQQARQTENLEQSLANRGIMAGSEQYNQQLEDLRNQQAGTLSDIANQSVFRGQDLLGSQIGNIGALSGQRDIGALPGLGGQTGANFQSTYEQALGQRSRNISDQNARNLALMQAAGQAAAGASDIRLKENLKPVGKLDNGLTVYVGNYKEEAGLGTTPQLFLIAQEVQKVNPESVVEKDGFLAVKYMEAVK